MEMQAFTESASPKGDASKLRNDRFTWCIAACLGLWILSLLPFLIACLFFHHKQSPKPCWFHASSPVVRLQPTIQWMWTGNCSGAGMSTSESSLEILESGTYFTYVYVACNETSFSEHYLFTVQLTTDSNEVLSILKGPNEKRAFVNLGRPYFLEKGTRLYLEINDGLKHIDINRTYWGLFKM